MLENKWKGVRVEGVYSWGRYNDTRRVYGVGLMNGSWILNEGHRLFAVEVSRVFLAQ